LEELTQAVQKQYYSGEGAIQWAGEAVARANADLLNTPAKKKAFLELYDITKGSPWQEAGWYLESLCPGATLEEIEERMSRYGLNPCGEIIGSNFKCNLSEIHCNTLNPIDFEAQEKAFKAGGTAVAVLLNHKFPDERYQKSREIDPIVGVSFTGGFDFFVKLFGVRYLEWWQAGRPEKYDLPALSGQIQTACANFKIKIHNYENITETGWNFGTLFKDLEAAYLGFWSKVAHEAVWDYCDRHNIKRPNRCTTVQPSGTKSLLTGASPGWHPPKAAYFIRRITFAKNDPIALACLDYGYNVIPSQSDKDENGNLLTDPFDPRTTEWLVEIPTKAAWADLEGADQIDISKFSVKAQWDFYMQVQNHYTTHNTSATIEIRESEIEEYAKLIYDNIQLKDGRSGGYISAALLARFDAKETFPRLPFEPISKVEYEEIFAAVKERRKSNDFDALVKEYIGRGEGEGVRQVEQVGPAGCDSDKCLFAAETPKSDKKIFFDPA
jgi:ribonucleotide reductase class II